MIDLEAVRRRTRDLWTLNDPEDKRKMDAARDDLGQLLAEVEALRMKVDLYTKHARMDARKGGMRC